MSDCFGSKSPPSLLRGSTVGRLSRRLTLEVETLNLTRATNSSPQRRAGGHA